ncbi:hypothetical protein EDS67_25415 [candidate division KSB1 bacterium]|nr:MAG: hypothetical protein EDS67_25415 [candidate division KSB1 bacterium]MBC6950022.1 hypothetical protein [candidate division KSB1 bacterium]MCE7945188.1 hypothetical protein [Chlorobi bacterium CHB1]
MNRSHKAEIMKCTIFFCTISLLLLFAGSPAGAQDQADLEAIHKLIDQYARTDDTDDLIRQAKLMSTDRVVIGILIALQANNFNKQK